MKKTLLLSAVALTAASMAAVEPTVYNDIQVVAVSPDGTLMAGENAGISQLVNLTTGDVQVFEGNEESGYTWGQGNMFSESGIAVGSTPEGAGYLVTRVRDNDIQLGDITVRHELSGGQSLVA